MKVNSGVKVNWLPNLVLLGFGLVFAIESLEIPLVEGGVGARIVPLSMSIIVIALVLLQSFNDLRAWRARASNIDKNNQAEASSGAGSIYLSELIFSSLPLLLLMAVYALLFIGFGYLPATLLVAVAAFFVFRNRPGAIAIHGVIGCAALYIVFIKLLGIYDPPGSLIDFSALFSAMS